MPIVYVKHNIFHKKSQYMTFHVLCFMDEITNNLLMSERTSILQRKSYNLDSMTTSFQNWILSFWMKTQQGLIKGFAFLPVFVDSCMK